MASKHSCLNKQNKTKQKLDCQNRIKFRWLLTSERQIKDSSQSSCEKALEGDGHKTVLEP